MVGDGPPGILTQPSPFRRSFIDVNGGFGPKGDYCGLGRRELGSYERVAGKFILLLLLGRLIGIREYHKFIGHARGRHADTTKDRYQT